MKKVLVLALALVMAICSLAMTGCGKEGVSFKDFSTKAQALKESDPVLTKGAACFKFSGDDDFGPDIKFELDEEGVLTYEKTNLKMYYEGVHDTIDSELEDVTGRFCFAWDVTEVEEKNEKTDSGNQFKTSAVYQTENEFSIRVSNYMKTAKGNESESISYKKYDARTGYIVEYYTKSGSGAEITVRIEWDAE